MPAWSSPRESEMLPEEAELADMLAARVVDLSRCDDLAERWRVVVGDENLDVEAVFRIELVDVLSQSSVRKASGSRGALLAARWLLGVVKPTLRNAERDTGSFTPLTGLTERAMSRRGTHAKIAFVCLKQDPSWAGAEASPERQWKSLPEGARVAFDKTRGTHSPRTRYVARCLHSALETRIHSLADPAYRAERFEAWLPALRSSPRAGVTVPDSVLSALRALAREHDTATSLYPDHMTPNSLARELTFSDAIESTEFATAESSVLFGRGHTFGGKPMDQILQEHRRLVVLGNPGGGKSTALIGAVVEALQSDRPAIFVRLTDLIHRLEGRRGFSLSKTVQLIVSAAVAGVPITMSRRQVADQLRAASDSIIALDGLDEVNAPDRGQVEALLRHLKPFPGTVIVSSRWTGFQRLRGGWKELSLDSLNPGLATQFITAWFAGENAPGESRALQALQSRSQSELTRIPVLLGILAAVASEEDVPPTEALLYQRYIAMFLDGHWRPREVRTPLQQRLEHLNAAVDLAWEMATGLTGRTDGRRWMDAVSPYQLRSRQDHLTGLLTLANIHGLVLPQGASASEAHQRFRWLHRTVHENLVGVRIASLFDADADYLGLDSNLIGGSAQWSEPLRHAVGLMALASQEVFIDGLIEMVPTTDAGSIMSTQTARLAEILPYGSETRRRAAARLEQTASLGFSAWLLDWDTFREGILRVYAGGDSAEMERLIHIHWTNWDDVDESLVSQMAVFLREADAQPSLVVGYVCALLSKFNPDAALDLFFEFRPSDALYTREDKWFNTPSGEATLRALEKIAANPRRESRHRDLTFLLTIGADQSFVFKENRFIDSIDVEFATVWLQRRQGDQYVSAADFPSHLQQLLLEGEMGSQSAFKAVLDHQGDPTKSFAQFKWGVAAKLGQAARTLRLYSEAEMVDPVKAGESMIGIDKFRPEALNDDRTALDTFEGLSRLLQSGSLVPLDWCFAAYQELGKSYMAYARDETFHTLRYTDVVDLSLEAVAKMITAHGEDVLPSLLETDPLSWISSPPRYARFDFLAHVASRAEIRKDDKTALIAWGARSDVDLLNYLDLQGDAEAIVRRLWEMDPNLLVAGAHEWARLLHASGSYAEWRDVIDNAASQWDSKLSSWKVEGSWPGESEPARD